MPDRWLDCCFDAETTSLLGEAFDLAWAEIQKVEIAVKDERHVCMTRDLIARRLIMLASVGERNRRRLVERALAHVMYHYHPPRAVRRTFSAYVAHY
jgi:hypothetical protein